MARIGSFVPQISARELRRRILVRCDAVGFDDAFEAARVWLGDAPSRNRTRNRRRRDEAGAPEFPGLRRLLEATPLTRIEHLDSDTADAACRALPFRHVLLSTPDPGPQAAAAEANLRAYFQEQLGAWSDGPPRIRYVEDPLLPRDVGLRVQFGHGVFLHESGAQSVGRFELAEAIGRDGGPGPWSAPRIGGRDGQPAAFYRGQTGLAFASELGLAPAVATGGVLPDGVAFFFGRVSDDAPPVFLSLPSGDDAAPDYRLDGDLGAEAGELAVLDPDGRPAFHLRWIGDDGPSALRARRPEGAPCLAVEGLVLPAAGWLREARRWWVDFTRSGRLSTAPMDERALAIVSDPSGAVRLYDRRERLDRDVFVAPQPIPLSVEQELRRPSFAADDRDAGRRWRTPLQGLRELGFIEIGQAGAQRFNPFRSRSPEEISLDWLNACGSVETRLRDDRGAARRIGLAEWSLQDAEVLCRLRDGAFEIVSRRNSRAARITADGRVEPLQADRPAAFRHGEAFLIGCLHLRYLSANGVSVGAAR